MPDLVTVIAVVSALSAVMWLVLLAQVAAFVLNPHGRDQLNTVLVQSGVSANARPAALVIYAIFFVLVTLIPAVLHGLAFYGLLALRKAGWIVAVVLAGFWILCVGLGIPFMYVLWKRETRAAFGLA